MKQILFALFSSLIFIISCKGPDIKKDIYGVWIFDKKINNLYHGDSNNLHGYQYPAIYDFKQDGELVIKNYGTYDTIFNWLLKSDSILSIDGSDYQVYSLDSESMSLIDYNQADAFWYIFKRPVNTSIEYSKAELEKILLSRIWSVTRNHDLKWANHFEYFDNNTMIYRNKIFDRNLNDSADFLQSETWGVAKYEDFHFLYSYIDYKLSNGITDRISQIIDIHPNSYKIIDTYRNSTQTSYYAKIIIPKHQSVSSKLMGKWRSVNSSDNSYGMYSERGVEQKHTSLFEGELDLEINEETISFKIDTLDAIDCNWQLSKDGRILVFEYFISEADRKGIHVEYADVLEMSDTLLKIRLFDNQYHTGIEKPQFYLLNLIQEFERIE